MHEDLEPMIRMLKQSIQDYAATALEFADADDRSGKITDSIQQVSINYLLDQACGVDTDTIKQIIGRDMELNAQGLDHWLTTL